MGLTEFSKCDTKNPERDTHRLLTKKFSLSLPVPISYLKTDSGLQVPLLKLRDWCTFLVRNSCWHIVTGLVRQDQKREEDILEAFWNTYKERCPHHPIFQLAKEGKLSLRRTAPVCMHGDEGRGRRRDPFLILSFRSLLGRGQHPEDKARRRFGIKQKWLKMKNNFRGHSYTNRFMFSALRKCDYTGENEGVFLNVLTAAANEAAHMSDRGVTDRDGKQYHLMLLHVIGDWPFLHKSGQFNRSFNNVQKRKVVRRPPGGVCHQCMAGVAPYQWEQIATRRPDWLPTMGMQSPFEEETPFRNVPHPEGELEQMWAFDLFHCFHLGVAKLFVASAISMLTEREMQGNIEERFESLSEQYKLWCQSTGRRKHVLKLTKELMGWPSTKVFPQGIWHKGALSTALMAWLEALCNGADFDADPDLQLVKEATLAIQSFMRSLYAEELWISPDRAAFLANLGFKFLRKYSILAQRAKESNRLFWILQPKHHALHHLLVRMWEDSERKIHTMNPLATSVQQDEDFIGRGSRLSRRVTNMRSALQRVFERYLKSVYFHFESAGYIVRPS